ncbi:MAG: hypothetical protein Q8M01_17075, partial [Rubrivivax sp.]|nr:hypothetical protein [Rubrivivax sp.]
MSAQAASVEPTELASMAVDATKNGAVAVVVHLGAVSFAQLEADGASKMTIRLMEARAKTLLQELAAEALTEGRWENKVGQMGLLVTPAGLEILARTQNAISFWGGTSRALDAQSRTSAFRTLQAQVALNGTARAMVRLRNEAADYDLKRDGRAVVHGGKDAVAEHVSRGNRVLASLAQVGAARVDAAKQVLQAQSQLSLLTSNAVVVDLDKRSLIALAHHRDVAALEPVGYVDDSAPSWDAEALEQARRLGSAEVLVFLRNPMPKFGLSTVEYRRMKAANSRALRSVLSDHGITTNITDISEFDVISAVLTHAELQRLYATTDRRLLGVELNKIIATTTLATSMVEMNLAPWWNADAPMYPDAGYQGAYPSIQWDPSSTPVPINVIVFDSGVQRTHPMLAGKVVFEACFGTNVDFVDSQGGNRLDPPLHQAPARAGRYSRCAAMGGRLGAGRPVRAAWMARAIKAVA